MTSQDFVPSLKQKTVGDAAIDGLIAGVWAGIIMVLLLLAAGFLFGESPALVLGCFDIQAGDRSIVGVFTHVAVSAIYGLLFGVLFMGLGRLWPALLKWRLLAGLAYGLILYALAQAAFSAGARLSLAQFAPLSLLLAHMLYGLVLG